MYEPVPTANAAGSAGTGAAAAPGLHGVSPRRRLRSPGCVAASGPAARLPHGCAPAPRAQSV